MRVMLVVEPGVDGVFRHVEGIAYGLLQLDIPVALAYSSERGSDRLRELVHTINGSPYGATLDLAIGNRPSRRDFRAAARLTRFVWSWSPHLIHAHSSKAGALTRGLKRLGLLTGSVIYTPNAYYGMNSPPSLQRSIFNAVERVLLTVGVTVNVSRDELNFAHCALDQRRSKRVLIHNSVDFGELSPASETDRKRLREQWGIPTDSLVLGSVGRLSWQKDPVSLIRAFALAREQEPRLFLLMLGQGELSSAVESAVAETGIREAYLRLEYASDPRPVYQMMDIFALASRYEGLAFSVLEALACDLPVVLTDVPGNRAFLGLGIPSMVLVTPNSVEGMAIGILGAAGSLKGRSELSVRARAKQLFDSADMFAVLHRLYESRLLFPHQVV